MTSSLKQLVEVAREKCFQLEGQTDCGNLKRVTTSFLKQLIEVVREKCFQPEGQTDCGNQG